MVVAVKAIPKSKVELNRPLLLELKRVSFEFKEPIARPIVYSGL